MATTHVIKHFNENKEVSDIINRVIKICRDDINLESDLERLTVILDEYQEQPHLLDPYLEEMICSCLDTVKDKETPEDAFHQTFRYLYLICKTRGAKYVLRFFTHEVADMEPVLNLLSQQNIHDFKTWQTRYCLLLWLSIICMIPFDLVRFDGSSSENGKGIIDSILSIAKKYISVADKSRDAAAYLLAKFLSRPDVRKLHLSAFLHWCIDVIMRANYTASMEGLNSVYGSLSVLCYIFKHGSREDLLVHAVDIFRKIEEKEFAYTFDILLKKLTTKVVQRLGLCLLKPRLAPWRYQRGNRSLLYNLQNPCNNVECLSGKGQIVDDNGGCEEENYEVPEDIEQILQHMLFALKDKDTVVRWSAAKGIGRICGRLSKDFADDVIGSVLEFFNPMEPDTGWHGGCLALAELGKRGLLLPERLPEVVPLILKALVFDERHVSYSSGANVRDAACYACWAFARAYEPKELTCHVTKIASALVIVSLFDREPNCRRAASAAFQEHVGRQGTFPHGIDILTTVDYFTVGNITNCYINLSVFVAKFPEYTQAIIDHLVDYKVCHWDRNVRQLASQSLAKLTAVSPHYLKCNVFPSILLLTNSTDLNTRHGALLAVAEVGEAIYSLCAEKSGLLDGESLHRIENIVSFLKENNYFNGLEGDFMRTAVCKLIEKFSSARIPLNWNVVVGDWQEVIDECLAHTVAWIQDMGVVAFHELCKCFYGRKDEGAEEPGNSLVDRFVEKLESSLHFDRMGYALGLGALPASMIEERKTKIIDGLLQSLVIQEKTAGIYAEPRRNSVKALTRICEELGLATTGEKNNGINDAELQKILESFFTSMKDYSVDSRGDVGAWVREEAMTGLEKVCKLMVAKDLSICPQNLGNRVFCCLVQQSAEKIDRTRGHAGETLLRMVHMKPPLPDIPHHQELREIFPESDIEKLNWTVPSVAFSNIIKLLPLSAYRHSVLLGITVSVGGLTESLVRHSSESLLQYIGSIQSSNKKMNEFTGEILTILEENKKNERIVLPMLRMVDLLISNGCFDMFTEESASEFSEKLATLLKCEVAGSGDTKKLMNSIKVFCGLLQFPGEGRSRSLSQLMVFLCHKYPLVRKETAETLYTTLITFEEVVDEENLEEVLTKLSDTEWDGNVEELRERRNAICNFLGVPVPKLKKKANKNKGSSEPKDALESYQDLVTRHGY